MPDDPDQSAAPNESESGEDSYQRDRDWGQPGPPDFREPLLLIKSVIRHFLFLGFLPHRQNLNTLSTIIVYEIKNREILLLI